MSKSLVSILEVAAIVGLQFIPGVGQAVGTALGAIGIGGVTAAQGLAIADLALAGAEYGINSLLYKAPKPSQTETAIRTEIPPRVSAYGTLRLQPTYILYETASDGWAVDVYAFHDGQIAGILQHYVGDRRVVLGAGGWVQKADDGAFGSGDCVQVGANLGLPVETAWSQVIAKVPDHWTTDHRGDGVVTGFMLSKPVKTKTFQSVYPTGGPNATPLSIAIKAQPVYDWRDETQQVGDPRTWKFSENAVLHLAHYLLVRMAIGPTRPPGDAAYWTDMAALLTARWNAKFASTVTYWTAAADDADIAVPLKGVQTILSAESKAGRVSVQVDSVTGLSVGMTISIYVSGDNSKTETRTVSSISGTTVGFSSGLEYDHPQGSQVLWSSSSSSPATEPRYRSCVAHQHTDAHKDVIAHLLACFDGWLVTGPDGAYIVYSGRYVVPTDDPLGAKEIVSMTIQKGVNEEDAINDIKVSYVSAPHDYATVQTDDWTDEDDIARRGKVLSDNLDNQVPSFSQARRLAKRAMAKINAPYRGTTVTTASARRFLGKRFVPIDYTVGGVTLWSGVAEVDKVTRNLKTGGLTIQWHAADPNVDAWDPATEEGLPAPVGNRVALQPLDAPTIIDAVADFSSVSDDGTGVRIDITAAGPDRDDVTWYARWRITGGVAWNEAQYSDVDAGASVSLITGFVPTGQSIDVEVAYGTGDGRLSDYSATTAVDTATDATAPDDATSVTVASWADSLNLVTDRIPRASSYRWRIYASDGTTLLRTILTATPSASYTNAQAVADGIGRSYVAKVAGVNAAGAGNEASSGVISLDAPAALTGYSATGGATEAEIDFDIPTDPAVTGFVTAVSNTADFDPMTQGTLFPSLGSPTFIQNLAAGTFYAKSAAVDAWTSRPDLLNFTSEETFVITTGGGGIGGGGGGGGGGYCPEVDTLILMANADRTGPGELKRAGDIVAGDWVWTRPELDDGALGGWGSYQVTAIEVVNEPVLRASVGIKPMRATAGHRMWLSGWVEMSALGVADGNADVAKITVDTAHTYFGNGVLHHNIKQRQEISG